MIKFFLNMSRLVLLIILFDLTFGCTKGEWAKPNMSPEQTHLDYQECETLSTLGRPPLTLAEKRSANPDLSSVDIEKCMQNKGYHWVSDTSSSQ